MVSWRWRQALSFFPSIIPHSTPGISFCLCFSFSLSHSLALRTSVDRWDMTSGGAGLQDQAGALPGEMVLPVGVVDGNLYDGLMGENPLQLSSHSHYFIFHHPPREVSHSLPLRALIDLSDVTLGAGRSTRLGRYHSWGGGTIGGKCGWEPV